MRLPRVSVRARLTALYAGVFVAATALLLLVSYQLLAGHLRRTLDPVAADDVLDRLALQYGLALLGITLIAVALPTSSVFVGRLVLFRLTGVTDSPVPLVAPALFGVTPISVLLFGWSYHTIPREIYDLSTEAGLGPFGTWWRVAMPLRKGAVAVVAALAFVVSWGNLVDPLLYVYDERWYTLPLGLVSLAELPPTDQGLMLAAALIAIAPALVTAAVVQRHLFEREM